MVNSIFVTLLSFLFVIALVFLILTIVFKKKKKTNFLISHYKLNIIITTVILVLSFIGVGILAPSTTQDISNLDNDTLLTSKENSETQENKTDVKKKRKDMTNKEMIMEDRGIDEQTLDNIFTALNSIGVKTDDIKTGDFSDNENKENLEIKQYMIAWQGLGFLTSMKSDNLTVDSISCGNVVMYQDGQAKNTVDNALLTSTQQNILETNARGVVKQYLSDPDSAKFSMMNWIIAKDGKDYIVKGSVKAKNVFNAKVDNDFEIIYSWDGQVSSNPTPKSFILGDYKII